MKLKIVLIVMNILPVICYTQIDCSNFSYGTFEIKTDYGNILVERSNGFQLEKFVDYGVKYLYKIEQIDDCEYVLKIQKIISKGEFPEPDKNQSIKVEVYDFVEYVYYYHSTESLTQTKMDGKMEKKSNSVSDEFNKILLAQ